MGPETDNGGEFLNAELVAYCEGARVTFTRGRAYRKDDQCYVEQKNTARSFLRELHAHRRS